MVTNSELLIMKEHEFVDLRLFRVIFVPVRELHFVDPGIF
jgi:hypothetical protein